MSRALFTLCFVVCFAIVTAGEEETSDQVDVISDIRSNNVPPLSVRIVGGRFALPGEVAHQIGIYFFDGNSANFLCGGSLISDYWILTAAHCVHLTSTREDFSVVVGTHNLSAPSKRMTPRVIVIHQFSVYQMTNDIAMIKLPEPVSSLNTNAKVINLPREFEENNYQLATVSGFGDTKEKEDKASTRLKIATVIIRPKDQCKAFHGNEFYEDMQICAGLLRGTNDTCQGDSGGPLFAKRPDGSLVLLGITSWGNGCGRRRMPGVYTRVSNYLGWIRKTMNSYPN